MALAQTLRLSTRASCAVRPALNRSRTMVIRAFKEGDKKEAKQQEASSSSRATTGQQQESRLSSRPDRQPLEVMPFRRMTDALTQMQTEMDAIMDHFGLGDMGFGRTRSPFGMLDTLTRPLGAMAPLARAPAAFTRLVPFEVEEDDTKYKVTMEVPGFTKSDIKVTLDAANSLLTITGQKAEKEGKEGSRSMMSFTRSFSLPQDVNTDQQIAARTEHGVLTVELPKSPAPPSPAVKEIPVEGA